jgi:hypothetical protein
MYYKHDKQSNRTSSFVDGQKTSSGDSHDYVEAALIQVSIRTRTVELVSLLLQHLTGIKDTLGLPLFLAGSTWMVPISLRYILMAAPTNFRL